GDFERGWDGYEARWQFLASPPSIKKPAWGGEDLGGKTILVYAEQGLGDTIQFCRYAPLLRRRGAGRVILACHRQLSRLLSRLQGVDQSVIEGEPLPGFDTHAALMSLPGLFGTRLDSVPADVPYLSPDPLDLARWRDELSRLPGLKVGIVWQGSPTHKD